MIILMDVHPSISMRVSTEHFVERRIEQFQSHQLGNNLECSNVNGADTEMDVKSHHSINHLAALRDAINTSNLDAGPSSQLVE